MTGRVDSAPELTFLRLTLSLNDSRFGSRGPGAATIAWQSSLMSMQWGADF
jgi:hypothetical protein